MHPRFRNRLLTLLIAIGFTPVAVTAAEPDYARVVKDTPGLLVHYRFETDFTVPDASGQGRTGTHEPADTAKPSAFATLGRAADLNAGRWIRVPDLAKHDAISVELWLKVEKYGSDLSGLYAADAWQPGAVHLNLKPGGAIEFAINGFRSNPTSEPDTVPLGKWVHLVATYDNSTGDLAIYSNGRRMLHTVAEPRTSMRLTPAALGAWVTGKPTRPLIGTLDEFAVYSVALTPAQVRGHYLAAKGVSETPVDFARDVRPILAQHCFKCHGEKSRKAGFRLDVRDGAFRGGESGEPGIERFDADASHLIHRVISTDAEAQMPPDDRLTPQQIAVLRTWIDQGAMWPDELAGRLEEPRVTTNHWSFQPVKKFTPPPSDSPFVHTGNAIDAFVFAKLREKGLSPSVEADRRTLIRRLYLDVHGLPPSPQEIEAFAKDPASDAWPKLVDRVLASPRYGERIASHWLDVIRYADTHGFEVNTPRDNAWPYRDYVIRSFNDDKPFDRFVREQIAGDQLGADAATGFLVAAPALLSGQVGKDEPSRRQARSDELHEVLVTVSSGVLGLTVGCARCHNHKFDPISQQDYYKLQAVFAGVRYGDRPIRQMDSPAKTVFAGTFTSPPPTRRLYRGDPMQMRERVSPDVPTVFGSLGLESTANEDQRRIALAKWLTDPANPLTARVMANRLWQHRFGAGLVTTPSDFGAMGVPPTNPELLDWLATTFVEDGWSVKKLTRRILLSNTYRQASTPNTAGLAADRDTAFLWRFPPRRLEMEPIRDCVLSVAGTLDLTMGGPGFQVFKANANYVRVYDAKEDWGPAEWRRMIYAHRVRMARDGVFGAFDCPDAGQPTPKRERSTTAIQALSLLNSTFTRQQSAKLAERVKSEVGSDLEAQITRAFLLTLGREPTAEQRRTCGEVAREHGLSAVALALFNSNEFLFLP